MNQRDAPDSKERLDSSAEARAMYHPVVLGLCRTHDNAAVGLLSACFIGIEPLEQSLAFSGLFHDLQVFGPPSWQVSLWC